MLARGSFRRPSEARLGSRAKVVEAGSAGSLFWQNHKTLGLRFRRPVSACALPFRYSRLSLPRFSQATSRSRPTGRAPCGSRSTRRPWRSAARAARHARCASWSTSSWLGRRARAARGRRRSGRTSRKTRRKPQSARKGCAPRAGSRTIWAPRRCPRRSADSASAHCVPATRPSFTVPETT